MRAHRAQAFVEPDGTLTLKDVPFKPGERVDVVVLENPAQAPEQPWKKLRGSVLRYDDPTEPVGVEDWEALK